MELNIDNSKEKISINSFSKELENSINKELFFSIDRFEGEFAVCENKQTSEMVNIKKSLLPENCKAGDIITFKNGVYLIDKIVTQNEKNEIKTMVNNLFNRK